MLNKKKIYARIAREKMQITNSWTNYYKGAIKDGKEYNSGEIMDPKNAL
jgi:hypothetical protein